MNAISYPEQSSSLYPFLQQPQQQQPLQSRQEQEQQQSAAVGKEEEDKEDEKFMQDLLRLSNELCALTLCSFLLLHQLLSET